MAECVCKRLVVKRVSRKTLYGNRNPLFIHQESHLNDRRIPVFFGYPFPAQPPLHCSVRQRNVFIRLINFKEDICDVIVYFFGCPAITLHHGCVDPVKDRSAMIADKVQCLVNIVILDFSLQNRYRVMIILLYRHPFGCRLYDASKEKELEEAVYIISDLIMILIRSYQL